jgi:DNA modification methylase
MIGIKDFRGGVIQGFIERGFVYSGDVTIDKNPQAQAIRTHAKALLFKQLRKDASWLRPGLADYILIFRKPGDNEVPIIPDITNNDWILWAHPVWYDIRESDTLNVHEARGDKDNRHMCPLQLPVIERCIRLWTNPGETVLSPFAGIGSEGYESVKHGRKFVGVELKSEYFNVAVKNLKMATQVKNQTRLF